MHFDFIRTKVSKIDFRFLKLTFIYICFLLFPSTLFARVNLVDVTRGSLYVATSGTYVWFHVDEYYADYFYKTEDGTKQPGYGVCGWGTTAWNQRYIWIHPDDHVLLGYLQLAIASGQRFEILFEDDEERKYMWTGGISGKCRLLHVYL